MKKTRKQRGGHIFYTAHLPTSLLNDVLIPYFKQDHITKTIIGAGGNGAVYNFKDTSTGPSPFKDENGESIKSVMVKIDFTIYKERYNKSIKNQLEIYEKCQEKFDIQIFPSILFAGLVRESAKEVFFPSYLQGIEGAKNTVHRFKKEEVKLSYIPPGPIHVTVMESASKWLEDYLYAQYIQANFYPGQKKDLPFQVHPESEEYAVLQTFFNPSELKGIMQIPADAIATGIQVQSTALSLLFVLAYLGYAHGDPRKANIMMSNTEPGQAILIDLSLETLRRDKHNRVVSLFESMQSSDPEWLTFTLPEDALKKELIDIFLTGLKYTTQPKEYAWMQDVTFAPLHRKHVNIKQEIIFNPNYYATSKDSSTLLLTEAEIIAEEKRVVKTPYVRPASTAVDRQAVEKKAAAERAARERLDEEIRQPPKENWFSWYNPLSDQHDIGVGGRKKKSKRYKKNR